MQPSTQARAGAALAGLAVVAGAFGAHALQGRLDERALATYEIAVRYQLCHALALVLTGLLADRGWRTAGVARAFVAGIAIFSGSLYALALSGVKWLGAITPIGGVLFVLGWLLLAWRAAPTSAPTDRGA